MINGEFNDWQDDVDYDPSRQERPRLEIADVIRQHGQAYRRRYGASLHVQQDRALRELALCRTASLGGHIAVCRDCGKERPAYNSCRNRHCPKCQGKARSAWFESRRRETLPVEYFHVVLTLPDQLAQLAAHNSRIVYDILCRTAGQAIVHVGKNFSVLQALMGAVVVLHSWGQLLNLHPHVHCIVPGGGLSLDDTQEQKWVSLPRGTFLPKHWLMKEFRARYVEELRKAYAKGKLLLVGRLAGLRQPEEFEKWIDRLSRMQWVTHSVSVTQQHELGQRADDPVSADRVVKYLAKYAGGMAMGNHRLLAIDEQQVTFWYKDYRDHGRRKITSLPGVEFIRCLLTHVLPQAMPFVRQYGFLSRNKRTALLAKIRSLLGAVDPEEEDKPGEGDPPVTEDEDRSGTCPHCDQGVIVFSHTVPRPTVAEIMAFPLTPQPKKRELEAGFS